MASQLSQNGCHEECKWQQMLGRIGGKKCLPPAAGDTNLWSCYGSQDLYSSKSQNLKYCLTQLYHSWVYTPRHVSQYIIDYLYAHVCYSTIHNSQETEAASIFINMRTDFKNVVHIHNRLSFSNKEEQMKSWHFKEKRSELELVKLVEISQTKKKVIMFLIQVF